MTKLFFLLSILLFFVGTSSAQSANKVQVLTMEVYGPYSWQGAKYNGIYLTYPNNAETEKIDFGPCNHPEDCLTRYSKLVQNKLTELLNDDWKLLNSSGGDSFIRYIWIKGNDK